MPELHIERVFKLRNFPTVDIRAVVASTEGAVRGVAQTGGRMQIMLQIPKALQISAGVYAPFGAARPELPSFVAAVIKDVSKTYGSSACFASRFNVSCTIENKSITQEDALRLLDEIGRKFEQQTEHVEIMPSRSAYGVVA